MSRGTESNTTGQRTLTGKRIVVTGGTGLVGSHLVAELLRQDCRVRLWCAEGSRFDRLDATLRAWAQRLSRPGWSVRGRFE